jgi:hypothetical protein
MQGMIAFLQEVQGGPLEAKHQFTLLGVDLATEAESFRATNRRKNMKAIFAASAQQMIGATFVIGYVTYFLEIIGIED